MKIHTYDLVIPVSYNNHLVKANCLTYLKNHDQMKSILATMRVTIEIANIFALSEKKPSKFSQ